MKTFVSPYNDSITSSNKKASNNITLKDGDMD